MSVLLTGGTGYIGSHTAVELLKAGEEIMIVGPFPKSSIRNEGRVSSEEGIIITTSKLVVCTAPKRGYYRLSP